MDISVKLFQAIAAAGGDKEKIDTAKEKDVLAKLLANNTDSQESVDNILKDLGVELTNKNETSNNKKHISQEHKNVGWKEIVEAYYPDLIEACNGKMFGEKGAIRAFQKELCTDKDGNLDKAKLKQLISATDLPAEIELPDNINGVERQNNTPKAGNYTRMANVRHVAPNTYVATDGITKHSASGNTQEEALENLNKQEALEYKEAE